MDVSFIWGALLLVFGTGVVMCSEDDVVLPFDVTEQSDNSVNSDADAYEWFCIFGWCDDSGGAEAQTSYETYLGYLLALQKIYGLTPTGILDNATKALMSQPRCGFPDYGPKGYTEDDDQSRQKRQFTHIGTMWERTTVTWYIAGYTNDLAMDQIEDEIRAAFQRWGNVTGLTLLQVNSPALADIILNFNVRDHGDGNSFDGPGGTLAHAYGPGPGINGDIHFDDDERYTVGPLGTDLHIVATHEIGHSLGLGHSSDSNAVMAAFYRYVPDFQLRSDDIAGIRALYGRQPEQPPVVSPTLPPPPPPTTTTTQAPTTTPPPTYCRGNYDAIANNGDGGLYFFEGATVLKVQYVNGRYQLENGYPRYIWEEFPRVYTAYIDAAVLFRYSSGEKILFIFNGDNYWRVDLTGSQPVLEANYPQSITARWGGIPSNLDAAYFWTGNNYLYFIKGSNYYRYSFYRGGLDVGYPRPLSVWRGVRTPVADAFDFRGRTYFFQEDNHFQQFNDRAFQAGNQFTTSSIYLGCTVLSLEEEDPTDSSPVTCGMDNGSSRLVNNTPYVLLLTTVFFILRQF